MGSDCIGGELHQPHHRRKGVGVVRLNLVVGAQRACPVDAVALEVHGGLAALLEADREVDASGIADGDCGRVPVQQDNELPLAGQVVTQAQEEQAGVGRRQDLQIAQGIAGHAQVARDASDLAGGKGAARKGAGEDDIDIMGIGVAGDQAPANCQVTGAAGTAAEGSQQVLALEDAVGCRGEIDRIYAGVAGADHGDGGADIAGVILAIIGLQEAIPFTESRNRRDYTAACKAYYVRALYLE